MASGEYDRSRSDADRIEESSEDDSSTGHLDAEDNVEDAKKALTKSNANGKAPRAADSASSASSKRNLLAGAAPASQPNNGMAQEPKAANVEEAGLK